MVNIIPMTAVGARKLVPLSQYKGQITKNGFGNPKVVNGYKSQIAKAKKEIDLLEQEKAIRNAEPGNWARKINEKINELQSDINRWLECIRYEKMGS